MWFVFFLIVLGLGWALLSPQSSKRLTAINVFAPTLKTNCAFKRVACIDDCSFLCVESNAKCIGGTCRVHKEDTECRTENGGIPVLTGDDLKHWSCLCTDSEIWSGPKCDRLNPDICENGVFMYKGRNRHYCFCPAPYAKLKTADGRIHCVEHYIYRFLEDVKGVPIGPSNR
jgi:hypothetical protein